MKIYYNKNAFKGPGEDIASSIFCMPFEDPSVWPQEPLYNNRFHQVIGAKIPTLEYTSLQECDYAVLPYEYQDTPEVRFLIKEANDAGKKIIVIFNDDSDEDLGLPEDSVIIFRTSFNASTRQTNEYPIPAFVGDFYEQSKLITDQDEQMTLGFCGNTEQEFRQEIIETMEDQGILKTNFILRKGFWAPELPKEQARREFLDNLRDNLFVLCMRGDGNFSYRLYETMMMGRIPVIIDSDQVFPFEDIINYDGLGIVIEEEELDEAEEIIETWLIVNQNDLESIQRYNRQIWEKYMSPQGWLRCFEQELMFQGENMM